MPAKRGHTTLPSLRGAALGGRPRRKRVGEGGSRPEPGSGSRSGSEPSGASGGLADGGWFTGGAMETEELAKRKREGGEA